MKDTATVTAHTRNRGASRIGADSTAAPARPPESPRAPRPGARRYRIAGVRTRLGTTPARLRLGAALILAGGVAFGVLAEDLATRRQEAVRATVRQAEPLQVAARLSAALSDADATAATTLLIGGLEPPALRRRYVDDLSTASRQVAVLAREVGRSGPERTAVHLITDRLPVYSGLVETARAHNRLGHPVGAAYLRRASAIMRDEILPAADRLYALEARGLNTRYRNAASNAPMIEMLVGGGIVLALLGAVQVYLARVTRRTLNPGLLAASAVLIALLVWLTASFAIAQSRLVEAQRRGSDSVEILAVTRILALRARGEESLRLVARGGGAQNVANFARITRRLGGGRATGPRLAGGLFGEAATVAARGGAAGSIDELYAHYRAYLRAHRDVEELEHAGRFRPAVSRAVKAGMTASGALDTGLSAQITAAHRRFDRAARDSSSALSGLRPGIPLLMLATAALAVLGLSRRIGEYR